MGDIGNVKSIVLWINLKSTSEEIFEGDPNAHLILTNAGTLSYTDFDNAFVDGIDTDTITTGWHLLIITSTTDVECTDAVLALNNAAYGEIWCSKIIIYDHEITPKERASLMSEFLQAGPITRTIRENLRYPKPTDLSNVPGLVVAYNMIPSPGGMLVDISGNGINGMVNGPISSKDGLVFNGSSDYIDLGSTQELDEGTILYRFNQKSFSANESHIGDTSQNFILFVSATSVRIRISGDILTFTIPEYTFGQWADLIFTITNVIGDHEVRCYFNGVESSTGMQLQGANDPFAYGYIGWAIGLDYFNGKISEVHFYSSIFSAQDVKNYHNSFANRISQRHRFDDLGVGRDSASLSGLYFTISGDFSVQELVAQDVNVPQLDKGTTWLQCDTGGAFRIPYTETTDVDTIIDYYNGSVWSRKEDTLANLITGNAWLSLSGDYLIFTLTAGDGVTTNLIRKGISQ